MRLAFLSVLVHLSLTSLAGFAALVAAMRFFPDARPATRASLFAGVLLIPAGSLLMHAFHPSLCEAYTSSRAFLHAACKAGAKVGNAGILVVSSSIGVAVSQWIASFWIARQILRGAVPVSGHLLLDAFGLREICERAGVPVPRIYVTARRGLFCTVGVLRPAIVVSQDLFDTLDPDEMRAALAHEVAHIARKDNALGMAAGIVRWLTFFSPVSHFAMSRYLDEREKAADDLALELTEDNLALASSIIKVLKDRRRFASADPAGVFLVRSERVSERIERLLTARSPAAEARLTCTVISLLSMTAMVLANVFVC